MSDGAYDRLTPTGKSLVDDAFAATIDSLRKNSVPVDDILISRTAFQLVDVIAQLIIDANGMRLPNANEGNEV